MLKMLLSPTSSSILNSPKDISFFSGCSPVHQVQSLTALFKGREVLSVLRHHVLPFQRCWYCCGHLTVLATDFECGEDRQTSSLLCVGAKGRANSM